MRFFVVRKTRGFDVVDTSAIQHEGFWCFCLDEQRAQTVADLLNDRHLKGKLPAAVIEALSAVQKRQE